MTLPSLRTRYLTGFAFVTLLAIATDTSARWFTVEMIVFDDLELEDFHAEHWPPDPGEPPLAGAIALAPPVANQTKGITHAFQLVDRSEFALGGVWRTIRNSARYRPLLHTGWRLPGSPRNATRPAHIDAYFGDYATMRRGEGLPMVRGTVQVSLTRYLQIELDLLYVRPEESGVVPPSDGSPTRFRLTAKRRMRSRELHYIDHPLFGVLVMITPFQLPSERTPIAVDQEESVSQRQRGIDTVSG